MKKCEENIIGKPAFKYEDEVGFYLKPYGETEEKFFIGKVYIIDAYGTFEQNEEPSYDIIVEDYNETGNRCLVKHVRQSECYILDGIQVEWSGCYPCLCSGKWTLKINGRDYSELVPFGSNPAYTYGTYSEWYFDDNYLEEFEDYEDGLDVEEWISENRAWLDKLPTGTDYNEVFKAFQEQDWRHGSCGGCI